MSFWITLLLVMRLITLKTKRQSIEWPHSYSPKNLKGQSNMNTRKVMATTCCSLITCHKVEPYMQRPSARRFTDFEMRSITKGADCWTAASSYSTTTCVLTQLHCRKPCFSSSRGSLWASPLNCFSSDNELKEAVNDWLSGLVTLCLQRA